MVFGLLALVAAFVWFSSPYSPLPQTYAYTGEGANQPMGQGRGIYPGRVVWVRDTAATPWDGTTGKWWEDRHTNQASVDRMFSRMVRRLTETQTDSQAWDAIFKYHNSTLGRGKVGYRAGEVVAIKINLNNTYNGGHGDEDNHVDASPQSVQALIGQLVHQAGVPQKMITVYEASERDVRCIPDRIYKKVHAVFPQVQWQDCEATGKNGRQRIKFTNMLTYSVTDHDSGRSIPTCVRDATYLINMSLMKGHNTAGMTLTAKNHYGTVNGQDHTQYVDCRNHPMGTYHPLVDLIGSPHLGQKTLLFIIDGLYGARDVGNSLNRKAGKWVSGPWQKVFDKEWSASFFVSFDPVAIDSVAADFLLAEYGDTLGNGNAANADNYLHEAALAHDPPSGTQYQPNGIRLKSLGVHEHWNNPRDKQYSRNLGRDEGIELISLGETGDRR